MKALVHGSLLVLLAMAQPAIAQQSQSFDGYTIHYNAINTSQLTPQIAQAYGIQRSSSRALLNITVLREQAAGQPARVCTSRNKNSMTTLLPSAKGLSFTFRYLLLCKSQ
jgi:hypothetical protein